MNQPAEQPTGHTEGPWHIDWNGGMAPRILGVQRPGITREISDVKFHNGSDDPQVHANARLIVQSPAMLNLLKILHRDWNKLGRDLGYAKQVYEQIEALIAKATS